MSRKETCKKQVLTGLELHPNQSVKFWKPKTKVDVSRPRSCKTFFAQYYCHTYSHARAAVSLPFSYTALHPCFKQLDGGTHDVPVKLLEASDRAITIEEKTAPNSTADESASDTDSSNGHSTFVSSRLGHRCFVEGLAAVRLNRRAQQR
jgi:hypothetical protein